MIKEIINNLNMGEKRYLSLHFSVYEKDSCLKKAIDTILAGKVEEKALRASIKNALQKKILALLSEFNSRNSSEYEIISLVSSADFLSKKKFYVKADKYYHLAMKAALDSENYALYFYALKKSQKNLLKFEDINKLHEHVKSMQSEINRVTELLKYVSLYSLNTCHAKYLSRKNHNPKTKIEQKEFLKLLEQPLFKNEKYAKDFSSKFRYYNTYALIYYELGNINKTLYYLNKQEVLLSNKLNLLDDYIDEYISVVYNMAVINLSLKNYTKTIDSVSKLESLSVNDNDLKGHIMGACYLLKLNCFHEAGNFDKLIMLENDIFRYVNKYRNPVLNLIAKYIYAVNYFNLGNYKKSLEYIHQIINDKMDNYREDIFCFARIINVLIHFEKEYFDALPYLLINAKNYLVKKKRYSVIEKIFIKYMKKISAYPDRKHYFLNEMKCQMQMQMNKNNLLSKTMDYFNFIKWIENKSYEKKI